MNSISLTANNFAVIDVTNFSQSTQLVFAALVALGESYSYGPTACAICKTFVITPTSLLLQVVLQL
jgi:hypothetical protein